MLKTKWTTALLLATALCAACDSRSGASVEPAGTAAYDAGIIELAKKSNCFSCHAMEKKMIGPPFKDIASKYRGDASAEEKLVSKVSKGSSGAWGSIPMPANSPSVTDADIRTLVQFTLSL